MRKVKFNKLDAEIKYSEGFKSEGWLHQWVTDSGGYAFGLIETADGLMHEIVASQIKFISPPEENAWEETKRHYAGLAMQGMLANSDRSHSPETIARLSVKFADELINALVKTNHERETTR